LNLTIRTALHGHTENGCFHYHSDSNSFLHFFRVFFQIPWYQLHQSQYQLPLFETLELHPNKNPFFSEHVSYLQYWVAYQNQNPVGRIAAWIDTKYDEIKHPDMKKKTGWIGLFESIDDSQVAHLLLSTALENLRNQKVCNILGPGRFNASSQIGLQIDGFHHPPFFMEPFNPPYYQQYFALIGEKKNDWYSFGVDEGSFYQYYQRILQMENRFGSLENQLQQKGIRVYSPSKKTLSFEVDRVIRFYNQLWSSPNHPQFSPLCAGEKRSLLKTITMFWEPSLIHIAETQNHELVGLGITVPDINEALKGFPVNVSSKPTSLSYLHQNLLGLGRILCRVQKKNFSQARVLILGSTVPFIALDAALYKNLYCAIQKLSIRKISASQIADCNLRMVNPLRKMGSVEKVWRVYQMQ